MSDLPPLPPRVPDRFRPPTPRRADDVSSTRLAVLLVAFLAFLAILQLVSAAEGLQVPGWVDPVAYLVAGALVVPVLGSLRP